MRLIDSHSRFLLIEAGHNGRNHRARDTAERRTWCGEKQGAAGDITSRIVKELKQVGAVDSTTGFKAKITLKGGSRMIVFVQEPENGPALRPAMRVADR